MSRPVPAVRPELMARQASMVATRRDLHRNPELGRRERRTSRIVAEALEKGGLEVRTGIAETGVLGVVRSAERSQRAILFRADMDALPLGEENAVPYASENPGIMHACGHDGHTAILIETALACQERRARLGGDVCFAFQPAEEGPGGARQMIEEGVLEDPAVEACFGLHLWNVMPVGAVGVKAGPAMAAADEFEITIEGKGGHGAYPHGTVDAVMIGCQVVNALQTIVSRSVDPFQTAVVSVGTFTGGSNFNIIAERAQMRGTVRTFDPRVRDLVLRRVREVAESTAASFGARARVLITEVYPATHNDPEMSEFVAEIAAEVVGPENVVRSEMSMGAEDMSYFLNAVPGCYFFLGSMNEAKGLTGQHHSPRFDFDEDAMAIGAEIFTRIQESYFGRFPSPARHSAASAP